METKKGLSGLLAVGGRLKAVLGRMTHEIGNIGTSVRNKLLVSDD